MAAFASVVPVSAVAAWGFAELAATPLVVAVVVAAAAAAAVGWVVAGWAAGKGRIFEPKHSFPNKRRTKAE